MKRFRQSAIQDSTSNSTLPRLTLRSKLTAANMLIAFLIVLVMGGYVYLRIQDGSRRLILSVEENARLRVEQDFSRSNREQATSLNGFFQSMSSNTRIAGDSIQTILGDSRLAENTYWDVGSKLTKTSAGSWDNPNSEPASIFIPAGVDLTDSLLQELNLLKHSELILPSILEKNPEIVAIYFGGESKETVYFPNIDLANIVPADFNVTGRQWYVSSTPQNNPDRIVVWSEPYEDAALNGLVITTSVPVFDASDRFRGVAAMDVQITRVIDLVSNVRVGETGYAFLVDNKNRLISLPESGYNDFGITDDNARLSEIIDPATLQNVSQEFSGILEKISNETSGIFTVTLAGSERHITFNEIPEVNYKLVFVAPSDELLPSRTAIANQIAQETRNTIIFSIIVIAVVFGAAAGLSFIASNRLTAPLQSLNHASTELSRGNFDAKAEIRSGDELETLAASFNTMADTVKDLVFALEKRVEERTAELRLETERGQRRGKQYEAIARVAQAITVQKNLSELLPQVTELISEQFGFYHVGIFLNDATNQYAVLVAANSEGGKRMLKRGHQLRVETQGIVGYVAGTKKPRIASSVGEDSVYFDNPDLPETQSEMALPLLESGEILGALDVQSMELNAFSNEDLDSLTVLAELVSIAIHNAKLYEQMQRSLAEAEAASRQFFRENWNRLAEEYRIAGYRYTAGGVTPVDAPENGDRNLTEDTNRKQVVVPIVMRGQEIGELAVSIPREGTITSDQMDMVRAVADRVAVIAENARLFDETTRRAEREKLVTDITTKIRGTNDPQEMIDTAIRELQEALKVSRIEIIPQKNKSLDS